VNTKTNRKPIEVKRAMSP